MNIISAAQFASGKKKDKKDGDLQVKQIFFLAYILLTLYVPRYMFAQKIERYSQTIKIAVLDNFTAEMSAQKYKDDYFDGIRAAIIAAKEKGFLIENKAFTYGSHPLDIFSAIPEVIAWKPDAIIGPHSSNQFLLLKKYFKDIMVISPYATDEAIEMMPKNFYSLSLPDHYIAHATVTFLEKLYPGRDIFNIIQADCKDCIDLTTILNSMYKTKFPQSNVTNSCYIGNNIKQIDLNKLLAKYKAGSIIILQPVCHSDAVLLMPLVANILKQNKIVFIYNLDNWGDAQEAKKRTAQDDIDFTSFRVSPYIQNKNEKIYKDFITHYQKLFNAFPQNGVSYMSYSSVMALINALAQFPPREQKSMRENVLTSFSAALKTDNHWYRPKKFIAYTIDAEGEKTHTVLVDFN